eukprot:5238536-Pleurochrysis_carterae.AAC.1
MLDQLIHAADDATGTDTAAVREYLTSHFGNTAPNVLDILKLWEAFGQVFDAWRDEWESETPDYRAA